MSRLLGVLSVGLLVLAMTSPVCAYLPPEALRQKARASRAMPEGLRRAAEEVARGLPTDAEPETLASRLADRFGPEVALPTALYAAVEHAVLRERILDEFARRIRLLEESTEALHEYLEQVHYHLRHAPAGPEGPALPELDDFPPRLGSTPEVLHVLRDLALPRASTPAARLRLLRQGALADLDRVEIRLGRAGKAQAAYEEQHLRWMRHLVQLAESARELSDRELLLRVRQGSE